MYLGQIVVELTARTAPTTIGVLLFLGQIERNSDKYKEYPYVLRVCRQRSRHSETTPGPPEA